MTSIRQRMPRKRLSASLAALAALALLATGCVGTYPLVSETATATPGATSSDSPEPTASAQIPNKPPLSDGVADEVKPFYEQVIDWAPCGDMECATVTAPLDWENPSAGEIELAVVRHRATSGNPVASLLTNPGGPGGSGYDFVKDSIDWAFGDDLQREFDIVGFDPRGVGRSTAVTCFDDIEMDDYLYRIPPGTRDSAEWIQDIADRQKEFADACEANSNGILPYVTTVQSAKDLDLLRGVLGDEQLHYLGFSYGTFLGSTYAGLFPERAGRLVLDAAIDPSTPGAMVGATQAGGFEQSLRAYLENCLSGTGCPFTGTVDDALGDISTLLQSLDAAPLQDIDGRMLGADTMMTAIVVSLYSEDSWLYLSMAFDGVLSGDPMIAFLLADTYNSRGQDGKYIDNQTNAFNAYNCVDFPLDSPEVEAQAMQLIEQTAPTIAPYWGGEAPSLCEVWPAPPTGTRDPITADGAPPILVVGTTGDPATPYEWSVKLAEQLSSGVLLTYEGEGHTAYNKGSDCVDDAIESFLIDGTVPADGTVCQ